MSGASLQVEDLYVSYGLSKALLGISLEVEAGEVLAVLGANGAGKSTLGRSVSGLVPVASGQIRLDGQDMTNWPAHKMARAGLTYIPEGRGIFPGLSVLDNLRMAVRQVGGKNEREAAIFRAIDLFPVLDDRRQQRAGTLSGGEQQMLAMARALATDPKVIIADEMSLGLAPLVVDAVFESLERARGLGITVILIEQFIHRALGFANRCVILTRGMVGWSGAAGDAGAAVLEQYLGEGAVNYVQESEVT